MTIAVDLDGTLAHYDHWRGIEHIGAPIEAMHRRVLKWLAEGVTVVIFTARITPFPGQARDTEQAKQYVRDWLKRYGLPELEITNIKRQDFVVFYDDRCVNIEANTGRTLGERWKEFCDCEFERVGRTARHAAADLESVKAAEAEGYRKGLLMANSFLRIVANQ